MGWNDDTPKKRRLDRTKATQRTQKWLKENGYLVAHTERKMPASARGWRGPLITQDLFGFIDTLAVNDYQLLAIQSCAGTDHARRRKKIMASPIARQLAYHMDIEIWSWDKQGKQGKRKLWTRRVECMTKLLLPKNSLLREKLENGTWPTGRPLVAK